MENHLKGKNWVLASLVLIVFSGVWTLVSTTAVNVLVFTAVYSVLCIVLIVLCYDGFKRKDRRWAIAAMAIGLFIVGIGIFGTALDLVNEVSLASGLVLFVGGIIGANN
ncbi:MAG: hypothetical protein ACQEQA_02885 [Bacillota bacterium]